MSIKHVFSNAIADGTNTQIVRPSDWNSNHNIIYALSGNTVGSSQVSGQDVTWQGGNNITLSADTAGSKLIISGPNVSQYLTTAAQSNHSHNVATTTTNGSLVVVATTNSAGATLAIPPYLTTAQSPGAYLTTAAQSNHSHNFATTTTNGSLIVVATTNSAGATIAVPPYLTTAQAPGAYLTTAMASNRGSDFMGTNTALTANGVSVTANSSGLSLNFPAFLTTAQPVGAYLTTAMASNRGSDFVHASAAFAGTNASGTIASNGVSVSVAAQSVQPVAASASNGSYNFSTLKFVEGSGVTWATQANGIQASVKTDYLTTAMLSNAATISNIRVSGGTTSNLLSAITFADSNGVSFGLNAGTLTATVKTDYQTAGAYLTTAMASNRGSDFVQANAVFNGTNASGTIASNGISVSVAGPQAGVGIAAGTRTATTAGNLLFDTGNGITFGLDVVGGSIMTASHNGLTTAMASNRGSDFMGTATALTAGPLAWTANSAGLSLNASSVAGTTTGFAGTNISGSMTHNTAGLSLNLSVAAPGAGGGIALSAGSDSNFTNGTVTFGNAFSGSFVTSNGSVVYSNAFLTTAAQSNHSHGNPTLALTNLSGTTASNSAGLTLSLSAAAGGAGDGYNIVSLGTTGTTGTAWSTASGTVAINGSGGVVVSQNNSNQIVISGPATSSIANTGQLSMSVNGSTISLGVPEGRNTQRHQWPPGQLTAVAALGNGSFSIHRMEACNPISASRLDVPLLVNIGSSATANTWGLRVTAFAAIYTKNGSTLSSLSSGSTAWSTSKASNSAGCTQLNGIGIRPMSVPMNVNMTPGEYYVGFGISTNTSSAGTATTALGNTWSIMGGMIYSSAVPHVGDFTAVTNTSTGLYGGHGVYSAAISTVPPTVSLSAINQTGSYYARGAVGLIFRNQ